MPSTPKRSAGGGRGSAKAGLVKLHRQFVSTLQEAVEEAPTTSTTEGGRFVSPPTDDLRARIEKANQAIRRELGKQGRKQPELRLTAEESGPEGELRLRVTHPTTAIVAAEVSPPPDEPARVEFFRTRPREDGVVETELLGVAKHPDRDGRHTVRFKSERFALRPDENVIIHGELVDGNGFILAAHAVAVIE